MRAWGRPARDLGTGGFRLAYGVLACSLVSACTRGCLTEPLQKTGLTSDPTGPAKAWFGLGEVDCPDGLARCVGGAVQTSQAARRPSPCRGSPKACACPWVVLAACPVACVAEGVEAILPPDRALSQLCTPASPSGVSPPYAHPPAPSSVARSVGEACEGETFVCLASIVVACEPSPRALATCAAGCSTDRAVERGAALSDEGAVAVLCAR